jgi:GNAT superfamily N-acetyltransferase
VASIAVSGPDLARQEQAAGVRAVVRSDDVDSIPLGDLSEFFDPFLRHFMKEALRCDGEVYASTSHGQVDGIFLYHDVEKEASIFTRSRPVAEVLHRIRPQVAVFSDFELEAGSEVYQIYAADPSTWSKDHRFVHPVRAAEPGDRSSVKALLEEVYGRVDERWLEPFPSAGEERCFVVDGGSELAGVGWVAIVNGCGRLHSLSVRPRYRRTGVGRDLFYARMSWSRRAGASRVISEISEENLASRALAESGGMWPIGRIFRSLRA